MMTQQTPETLAVIDETAALPIARAFLKMTAHATLMEQQRDRANLDNEALRDALRVRMEYAVCPECVTRLIDCSLDSYSWISHAETCSHHKTEQDALK